MKSEGSKTQQAPPEGGARWSTRGRHPGRRSTPAQIKEQEVRSVMSVRDDAHRTREHVTSGTSEPAPTSHVYVIGRPASNVVKLGTTTQLAKRLRALQLSSPVPLEILWATAGDRAVEAALHLRFAALRQHGEWFDFGDEDPVRAVRAAFEAGLPVLPTPRTGNRPNQPATESVPEESLCTCGHALSFHHGRPRACVVAGWDEWLDCQCSRFTLAALTWHVGLPACEGCSHPADQHGGSRGPCTSANTNPELSDDEWCRCYRYYNTQVGTPEVSGE